MFKQKKIYKLSFIMAIVLFSICIVVMQVKSTSAFAAEGTNQPGADFISDIFGKKVQTLDYLYNFDLTNPQILFMRNSRRADMPYFTKIPLNRWNIL